ncbi:MAG: SpoIIE family protein phosphatase [Flavobacteriales bacterium]|nr:SpoIIE family protein phosphatase [Flavobacteriales bacterium]
MEFRPKRTKHKVLYAVYGTLLVLCAVVIAIVHNGEEKAERTRSLTQLGSITSTLAEQLNAAHVRDLRARYDSRGMIIKNTQDAWYYVMHERLRKAAERNGLSSPLEVIAYDDADEEMQVIVTSAEIPSFRAPWQGDPKALLEAKNGSGSTTIGSAEHAELVAFEAMRTEDGELVGLVVARSPAHVAKANAMAALFRNIGIAVLIFGIAGILLFRYVGRWLKHEEDRHRHLQDKHAGITDSIAYAGKIQRALVPSSLVYDTLFADSFVIDRPKDVVSGDFHWVHRIDEHTCYVAAADCTGHGLPGAMMAAIGCSLLNEIVPKFPEKDPAEILAILHTRMVSALNQQGKQRGAGDGMDVALCRVDRRSKEILFAGAFRPVYWLHQGQLSVINGDRRPVGGGHNDGDRKFTSHRLAYTAGDRIYLFSDGYVDQFGGPERKRFMTSKLQDLIARNQHLPLKEQALVFDRTFLEWKGNEEQLDDVCMLGLAV